MFKLLFLLISLILTSLCHAFVSNSNADEELRSILQEINTRQDLSLGQRLNLISQHWLNRPYSLYCLGEGPDAEFDQHPLYRTDAFDCETLVETSLALALAKDLPDFQVKMNQIRYHHGKVDFIHRNHFTNIDWNHNNQEQGLIRDYSSHIKVNYQPINLISTIIINKKGWYQKLTSDRIYLPQASPEEKAKKLQKLHDYSESQGEFVSKLRYLPINKLYDAKNQPIMEIFQQIPDGSILQLVTPKRHTQDKIGTDLDIIHMGLVFHQNSKIMFRHASYTDQKVEELPLDVYLKAFINHATIKGIHLEIPLTARSTK